MGSSSYVTATPVPLPARCDPLTCRFADPAEKTARRELRHVMFEREQ
jgi:hypothetical protein